MRIAIVDDDVNWLERIKDRLIQCNKENKMEIDLFTSGEQYLDSNLKYDISFIDIEMPKLDGFDTILQAKEYHPDGIYIILTAHVEMSRKGYVVNAFRYIDKMHLEELQEAIESARNILRRNATIEVNVIGGGVRKITLKNLIYIETEKHYIIIHTKHGVVKSSNSLKDVEKLLPEDWFYRCHNVYIVNLDEISGIKDRIVYLSNGDDIDVSHRKMSQFKKMYFNRQYECANK